jgi:hypothetical protein
MLLKVVTWKDLQVYYQLHDHSGKALFQMWCAGKSAITAEAYMD